MDFMVMWAFRCFGKMGLWSVLVIFTRSTYSMFRVKKCFMGLYVYDCQGKNEVEYFSFENSFDITDQHLGYWMLSGYQIWYLKIFGRAWKKCSFLEMHFPVIFLPNSFRCRSSLLWMQCHLLISAQKAISFYYIIFIFNHIQLYTTWPMFVTIKLNLVKLVIEKYVDLCQGVAIGLGWVTESEQCMQPCGTAMWWKCCWLLVGG